MSRELSRYISISKLVTRQRHESAAVENGVRGTGSDSDVEEIVLDLAENSTSFAAMAFSISTPATLPTGIPRRPRRRRDNKTEAVEADDDDDSDDDSDDDDDDDDGNQHKSTTSTTTQTSTTPTPPTPAPPPPVPAPAPPPTVSAPAPPSTTLTTPTSTLTTTTSTLTTTSSTLTTQSSNALPNAQPVLPTPIVQQHAQNKISEGALFGIIFGIIGSVLLVLIVVIAIGYRRKRLGRNRLPDDDQNSLFRRNSRNSDRRSVISGSSYTNMQYNPSVLAENSWNLPRTTTSGGDVFSWFWSNSRETSETSSPEFEKNEKTHSSMQSMPVVPAVYVPPQLRKARSQPILSRGLLPSHAADKPSNKSNITIIGEERFIIGTAQEVHLQGKVES